MITAADTASGTPGLAKVRVLGQTIRRRLPESGLRAMRPVVTPILKQRHRTARLAWASRRWRLHAWQHIFLVFNPNFHFGLAMDVILCTAGMGNVLGTSVCTSPTVLEEKVLWSGLEFVMMVALSSKLFKDH